MPAVGSRDMRAGGSIVADRTRPCKTPVPPPPAGDVQAHGTGGPQVPESAGIRRRRAEARDTRPATRDSLYWPAAANRDPRVPHASLIHRIESIPTRELYFFAL